MALEQIDERFDELAHRPEAVLANLMLPGSALPAAPWCAATSESPCCVWSKPSAYTPPRTKDACRRRSIRFAEVPVPLDPATGRAFEYRVDGDTAVLTSAEKGLVIPDTQFEITVSR